MLPDAGMELVTNVADTFAAAARAASRGKPTGGLRRTAMSIFRTEALISYQLDEAEETRRRAAGESKVPSADVLELLLGLPTGMPVPVSSLTGRERDALGSAPVGFVVVEHGHVTRYAIPPVSVDLALVGAPTWRRGLEVAGRFTPFCARAMVLADYPTNLEQLRIQADFYGVGVIVSTDEVTEVLVEPAPFRRVRFTAAGWQFLERVYRHR
jgi:hypothetical protein